MPPGTTRFLVPILKIFFDLLYHQFAWTYDIVSGTVSLGMWNNWIRSISPDISGSKILELGHGPGHLQIALNSAGIFAYGLDLSPQMGKICARRLRRRGITPKLVNGSGLNLPFPDNQFDQVVATFPTEYILAQETIAEIFRAIIPGGKLIILPMVRITGENIFHRAAAWLFNITGQAGDFDDASYAEGLAFFEKEGFMTELEIRKLHNSEALILHATKVIDK